MPLLLLTLFAGLALYSWRAPRRAARHCTRTRAALLRAASPSRCDVLLRACAAPPSRLAADDDGIKFGWLV
jgi:hypothetical protein